MRTSRFSAPGLWLGAALVAVGCSESPAVRYRPASAPSVATVPSVRRSDGLRSRACVSRAVVASVEIENAPESPYPQYARPLTDWTTPPPASRPPPPCPPEPCPTEPVCAPPVVRIAPPPVCAPPPVAYAPPPAAAPAPVLAWHVRGLLGWSYTAGPDKSWCCGYYGGDLGVNFGPTPGVAGADGCCTPCGCGRFGVDLFYRMNFLHFKRNGGNVLEDGGIVNSIGLKATYEKPIGNSRFLWYAGLGPEYVWTTGYLRNDNAWGVFGEAGIGYRLSTHFVARAGLDLHALYTDVGRRNAADDGKARWLWVYSPIVALEYDF